MRRDLITVLFIMLASFCASVVANEGWHRLDWIRKSPAPGGSASEDGEHREDEAQHIAGGAGDRPVEPRAVGLTVDAVLEHLQNGTAFFVDAREAHNFAEGHLAGAIHLPQSDVYGMIEDVLAVVSITDKLIVYCGGGSCEASHVVAEVLREYEFTDVEIYANGWEEIESLGRFTDFIDIGEEP